MAFRRSRSQLSAKLAIALVGFLISHALQANTTPKNIILLIGDGMGVPQVGLLETYARHAPNSLYQGRNTAISQLALSGKTLFSLTSPYGAIVVDSACSATQLAIGEACRSEMIGLNAEGHSVETLVEKAKRLGKSTGLVSDTRITHATPAAFAAHQAHRSLETAIAQDLINNQVDVLLSGGLSFFLPQDKQHITPDQQALIKQAKLTTQSKRDDNQNLLSQAQQQGYALALSKSQLNAIQQPPVLGLFQNSVMPDALSEKHNSRRSYPSLKEMTEQALALLEQNPKGFFLMIEGGQIDWTGHNNDAGGLLHEMLKFDAVIQQVINWAKERDDTLIVLTADHETGGFGFSYSNTNLPEAQPLSGQVFKNHTFKPDYNFANPDLLDKLYAQKKGTYAIWLEAQSTGKDGQATVQSLITAVNNNLPFTINTAQARRILSKQQPLIHDFSEFYVYTSEAPLNQLAREIAAQQNVVWSTGTHTASPVPVIIKGPKTVLNKFQGLMTHVELGALLKELLD